MKEIKLEISKYFAIKRRREGSVLVYSVIIMLIMLAVALGMSEVVMRDTQMLSSASQVNLDYSSFQ